MTTAQLHRRLPVGFNRTTWSITKKLGYPYLSDPSFAFVPPLATLVASNKVYALLPIGQRDPWQYLKPPAHGDAASLATVYTMFGRAVGIADDVAPLKNVRVDRFFWDDATQTTTFAGPVTGYAVLGRLASLPRSVPLSDANVIGQIRRGKLVVLRGAFIPVSGTRATHWMLATLVKTNPDNTISAVVANDPWMGSQVLIDPVTKRVVSPPHFPLKGFRVDGYQPVTVN